MPYILKAEQLETQANKVSVVNENSTDNQYPSAKAVYDAIGNAEGSVGHKTAEGGEIFNNYETNKALSKHATAIGSTDIAGGMAFTITATEDLGEGSGTYTLSSTTGLEVGMEYSAVLSKANYHAGRITAINENIVTVDGYVYYKLNTNVDNPEKFNMYNCFIITGRPDLGDKSIGFNAFAAGNGCCAQNVNSTAIGYGSIALGKHSVSEGYQNITGHCAHAEGSQNLALGDNSHAENNNNKALGDNSHAEGYNTQALGNTAHSEGNSTVAEGLTSHAEGFQTKALAEGSHAEGFVSDAQGEYSHTEGYHTNTSPSGKYSHAEGYMTKALKECSHSEGLQSEAQGMYSHAEGIVGQSVGEGSHAEGYRTRSEGRASHSEGYVSTAKGDYSHAEGYYAHSIGEYSHAEGYHTKATAEAQSVVGRYNKETDALFVVGNGSSDTVRNNAFMVNKDGTASVQKSGTHDNNVVTYEQLMNLIGCGEDDPNTLPNLTCLFYVKYE
jgi:hypothetical protein